MENKVFVLGASDPEMEAIERLLRDCGQTVLYATYAGDRVRPGTAYRADGLLRDGEAVHLTGRLDHAPLRIIAVECDGAALRNCVRCGSNSGLYTDGPCGDAHDFPEVTTLDHHRQGDPGYGRPPKEFMSASAIGQVITELAANGQLPWQVHTRQDFVGGAGIQYGQPGGWELWREIEELEDDCANYTCVTIPQEYVITAAADHCLGAAYRGACPGVDPDSLMKWRAQSRATFQDREVSEVLSDIVAAQAELETALTVELAPGQYVCDMRRERPVPELPEAATRLGVGYVSGPLETPNGSKKVTCSGSYEQVYAFINDWGPREGLVDIYGDPARGFAGGYIPG